MNQPVRRELRTRDATQTNQFRRDGIILWKSFDLSSKDTICVAENRSRAEFSGLSESSHPQAWKRCGAARKTAGKAFARPDQLGAENDTSRFRSDGIGTGLWILF
ncbi:hypothetical protein JQ596_01430 [Bradyrhizobium manausense]|uniref:hypothetical protein n=1 Tax=Bradyrhizobium TaxID=374 RepID=UPI001BA56A4D|nr:MULTISPECIES: hypothetical protein [Bradyrhizobium]MBR0824179.1 hypothetical protein [Bradyrhizobium manausense]UVO26583.1 hypothetical protein KUF59_29035 [Bradyrhizobium arachidis]